jgi:HEAT repeat protein
LPNLELLAKENNPDIKRALLDQFIPLINYIKEQSGQQGYDSTVTVIFPLLDEMLYDPRESVRDKAIEILTNIRSVVQQKENDYIMKLTLKLAHDDSEQNKVSALKILNELAPDMGQILCEHFIGQEIRSLGIDEGIAVRQTVAKNLLNISKIVSLDYFTNQIFPLYNELTKDKDEKVRKTCAEVVAEIANVSPLEKKGQNLADIYYRFLKDPTSKIVRGTAF